MRSVPIIIFLVFNSALSYINAVPSFLAMSSSTDGLDIELSQEQYIQAVIDFWTDERLQSAKPRSIIQIDRSSLGRSSDDKGEPTTIDGTTPMSSEKLDRVGFPITVGKVFFVDDGDNYACSASVVTSDNEDMIFTAGHCVFSTHHSQYVTKLVFIPQYENRVRPYGTWPARCLYALPGWVQHLDHDYDVAIVLLHTVNGRHIQNVVGSQGVGFSHDHSSTINSFGYPSNYYQGEIMTSCTGTKYSADIRGYHGDKIPCLMNQGCSGGPWFESYNQTVLTGVQTSVNSFMLVNVPGEMYGPYFGSAVQSLYQRANGNDTCPQPAKASSTAFSIIGLLSLLFLQFLNGCNTA